MGLTAGISKSIKTPYILTTNTMGMQTPLAFLTLWNNPLHAVKVIIALLIWIPVTIQLGQIA